MTSTLAERADETSERLDGKTPNGGDYAIAYFLDANRKPVSKSEAVRIEIVEFNANGESFHHTTMIKSS